MDISYVSKITFYSEILSLIFGYRSLQFYLYKVQSNFSHAFNPSPYRVSVKITAFWDEHVRYHAGFLSSELLLFERKAEETTDQDRTGRYLSAVTEAAQEVPGQPLEALHRAS